MEVKVNHTIVGLFAVSMLIALIIVVTWLSSGISTEHFKQYQVLMNESVAGLNIEAPVKYNGVQVGSVAKIGLDPNNPQRVLLLLDIFAGTPILTSTEATLKLQGITGLVYVGLATRDPAAPILLGRNGQLPLINARPSLSVRVDTAVTQLTNDVTKIGERVSELFSHENGIAVRSSLQDIQAFSSSLAQSRKSLESVIKQADDTLRQTAEASQRLPQLTHQLEELSQRLNHSSTELEKTMRSSRVLVDQVSTQLMPEFTQAMSDMHSLTHNLIEISEDVERDPNVLLRGRRKNGLGPGE